MRFGIDRAHRSIKWMLTGLVILQLTCLALLVILVLNSPQKPRVGMMLSLITVDIALTSSIWFGMRSFIFKPMKRLEGAIDKMKNGQLTEIGLVKQSMGEMSRIEEGLLDAADALHRRFAPNTELEKKRKVLLASISHDLRTPLTAITGYVESMQDGIGSVAKGLEVISNKAEQMNHLIDDLDVFAKHDLDKLVVVKQVIRTDQLMESYASGLRDPRIRLLRPVVATYIEADPYRFNQVLENVVGNAKKHAKGRIEISSSIDGEFFTICVADDGPGIPAEYRDKVFDAFFMVNRSGGTGLGLSIAQSLVKEHGGDIRIGEPMHGNGATFFITYPICPPPPIDSKSPKRWKRSIRRKTSNEDADTSNRNTR